MPRIRAALTGNLERELEKERRAGERAVTRAVRAVGKKTQAQLRAETRRAELGVRVERAWRLRNYPQGGESLGSATLVYSKAAKIVLAFAEGATIRSKLGLFLAIPTENAPKKGVGGKRISPSNFPEHRFGPLRFVFRRGGPSLLVADNVRASFARKTGQFRGFKSASDRSRRTGKGLSTAVMFILVPQVTLKKRLDIRRIADRMHVELTREIVRNWDAEARKQRR